MSQCERVCPSAKLAGMSTNGIGGKLQDDTTFTFEPVEPTVFCGLVGACMTGLLVVGHDKTICRFELELPTLPSGVGGILIVLPVLPCSLADLVRTSGTIFDATGSLLPWFRFLRFAILVHSRQDQIRVSVPPDWGPTHCG